MQQLRGQPRRSKIVGKMDSLAQNPGSEHEAIETGDEALATLYRNAFEVRERMGLDQGSHIFYIDHPKYFMVEFVANSPNDTYVDLHDNRQEVGSSFRGLPYLLDKSRYISKTPDGNLFYANYDQIMYKTDLGDAHLSDAELDGNDQEFNGSEPLPPDVVEIVDDMNSILHSLTIEQYDVANHEAPVAYDPVKKAELEALEEALSTAGGAFALMQLAIRERYNGKSPKVSAGINYVLTKEPNDNFEISFYPDVDEDGNWLPYSIQANRKSNLGPIRSYRRQFEQYTNFYFSDNWPTISLEIDDYYLQEEDDPTSQKEIFIESFNFEPDDVIADNLKQIVKVILREIVGSGEEQHA